MRKKNHYSIICRLSCPNKNIQIALRETKFCPLAFVFKQTNCFPSSHTHILIKKDIVCSLSFNSHNMHEISEERLNKRLNSTFGKIKSKNILNQYRVFELILGPSFGVFFPFESERWKHSMGIQFEFLNSGHFIGIYSVFGGAQKPIQFWFIEKLCVVKSY